MVKNKTFKQLAQELITDFILLKRILSWQKRCTFRAFKDG